MVEPRCQRTEAKPVRVRTEEEPEGRSSLTKAKGVEGRGTAGGPEVMEAERLTKPEPKGRGSLVEPTC